MDSTFKLSSDLRSRDAVKPTLQLKRTQPVRLPQATNDLVNRMLARRCGANR